MEKRLILLDGVPVWAECSYNNYWDQWQAQIGCLTFLEGRFRFLNPEHMENVSRCS